MRPRSAAPPRAAVAVAVADLARTTALSSVAAIDSSVDLPAPFGPSSATISPARQVSDTRLSARRRPKLRVTSWNVSASSRSPLAEQDRGVMTIRTRADRDLVVERGVDAFERGHELAPARRVALRIDRLLALPLSRARSSSSNSRSRRRLELAGAGRRTARCGCRRREPPTTRRRRGSAARAPSASVARPGRMMRHARKAEAQDRRPPAPRRRGRRCRGCPSPASSAARRICGDLSCMSPTFCATTATCASVSGSGCSMTRFGIAERHRVRDLHQRAARRERPGDLHLPPDDRRLRRRALEQRGAARLRRQLEHDRLLGLHRRRRRRSGSAGCRRPFSPSSPISNTNRDSSPSTTVPGCAGPGSAGRGCRRRRWPAAAGAAATSTSRMPPLAGIANSCDSSRSPATVATA